MTEWGRIGKLLPGAFSPSQVAKSETVTYKDDLGEHSKYSRPVPLSMNDASAVRGETHTLLMIKVINFHHINALATTFPTQSIQSFRGALHYDPSLGIHVSLRTIWTRGLAELHHDDGDREQ